MDENNRNFITAIVLSIGVLFAWQYFFVPKTPQPSPASRQQSKRRKRRRSNRQVRRSLGAKAGPCPGGHGRATRCAPVAAHDA